MWFKWYVHKIILLELELVVQNLVGILAIVFGFRVLLSVHCAIRE